MYLQYFGLHENPFSIPPDPQYLYLSRGHQEALAHLQYGLSEAGGFVQLTGEVGTGKTLLIRALVERLPEGVDVALILYPVLTVSEFVAAICDELRVPYPGESASLKHLIDALNTHLLRTHAQGRRTVLIIDEAQNLSREVLEQIRLLTNLETTKQKLLQIILIGQPELSNMLAQQDLRQLAQRITARYSLAAITHDETRYYIAHRCRVAGARRLLFKYSALHHAHVLTGGIPRLINILCDRALLGAYTHGESTVDVRIVRRAAKELGSGAIPKRRVIPWTLVAGSALAVVLAVSFWYGWQSWPRLSSTVESVAQTAPSAVPEATAKTEAAVKPVSDKANSATVHPETVAGLEIALSNPETKTDTDTALKNLFDRWGVNYTTLNGGTGCERALKAGLQCIYQTGTWNNLREHNRPAVIELQDSSGTKHHVLVSALTANTVSLVMGDSSQEFSVQEVGRFWFGKYLLLLKPSLPEQGIIRLGDRGEAIIKLRDALARYRGEPLPANASDVFDKELQVQLMQFQSRHHLATDGVVGQITLAKLQNYLAGKSPTLDSDNKRAEAR
jgi:general secretion pathway protein A